MEGFSTETMSLSTLSVTALAVGLGLFLWTLTGRPLKLGPFYELGKIVKPLNRLIVGGIALSLAGFGGFGIWYNIPRPESTPTLTFYTDLAEEELTFLREDIVRQFEQDHDVNVNVECVRSQEALRRLKEGQTVDLLAFDINGRLELLRNDLVEELTEEKGLIPSSVNPVLFGHLSVDGKTYFAPFRPNVQLVFANKGKLLGGAYPYTWQEVLEAAKELYERDGEARVIIHAKEDVVPHTLLQIVRSADGKPCDLLHPQTKEALAFVQDLYQYVSPKSRLTDYQTAGAFLLADSAYLARNWTFALGVMHEAGRDEEFETYAGWRWGDKPKPSNLLGGDVLAVPRAARLKEEAIELMRFLMSKDVQEKLMTELCWPPMRMDAMGAAPPWQQPHQQAITEALLYAKPVPDGWSQDMNDIYRELFAEIVGLDEDANDTERQGANSVQLEEILARYQNKIDGLGIPESDCQ